MSEPNLNAAPAQRPAPPERFDIKSHVHEEKPFVSGFKMLLCVCGAGAALAVSVLGGAYLLAGGQVPEFAQLAAEKAKADDEGESVTSNPEKAMTEKADAFFASYSERWNQGAFPSGLTTSEFAAFDAKGRKLASTSALYDPKLELARCKVTKVTQLADNVAEVEVTEFFKQKTTMKEWYENVEGDPRRDPLIIEQAAAVRYAIDMSGGRWRLAKREILSDKNAKRIRQASDGEPDIDPGSEAAVFEDKRLTKEILQARYDENAQSLGRFTFPSGATFESEYGLGLGEGSDPRTPAQLQTRLDRARTHLAWLTVAAKVESMDQVSDVRATVEVRYRAEFAPDGSRNIYLAVWRDRDTWATAKGGGGWYLLKTERLLRSPLMEHYEELAPHRNTSSSGGGHTTFHGE